MTKKPILGLFSLIFSISCNKNIQEKVFVANTSENATNINTDLAKVMFSKILS